VPLVDFYAVTSYFTAKSVQSFANTTFTVDVKTTMAAKGKRKTNEPVETRQSIEEQTRAFLKAGGQIEKIQSGVSGQASVGGPKQSAFSKRQS
jgi:hypothetical protein